MATKMIKSEEIPDWEYGDVAVKTFNYGERLMLADLKATVKGTGFEIKEQEINIKDVSITGLAAGIHYIRTKDNNSFLIREGLNIEDKKKIVFNFSSEAGTYLIKEIYDLNKPVTDDEKKN